MSHSRFLHPKANDDIYNIARDYEDKKAGLGKVFLSKVSLRVKKVCNKPSTCQIRYGEVVRLAHLTKFPYSIHYVIDENRKRVVVLAVFGMKENPEKWEERYAEIKSEIK